jgi:mannitol-1-phosphate/altronate dehydrogenase
VRPFLDNAQQAAALDRQIEFTDGLIDRIVYRLYGLSEDEVAVVEGT